MKTSLTAEEVFICGSGRFFVRSEEIKTKKYEVFLGDHHSVPYCQCKHWEFEKLPCKHMVAVWSFTNGNGMI